MELWLRIEEPGGPGLDLQCEPARGLVVTGVRGGAWRGFDLAVVADTDTGDGRALPAVVALPHSAPPGAMLHAELAGGYVEDDRAVVVATLPGHPLPMQAMVRVAARVGPDARPLDAAAAERVVTRAHHRFRRRRAEGRRIDQPAWLPLGIGTGSLVGAAHSGAELTLAKLPPRFVRGLRDLLDADERILAAVERPPEPGAGLALWRRRERRAGLLVLTDRQLAWLVDHLPPNRYLVDWGVDATLVPLEALTSASVTGSGLEVRVRSADLHIGLPPETRHELAALVTRLDAFVPTVAGTALRRRYPLEPVTFPVEDLQPYLQVEEAAARLARLTVAAGRPVLACFYAPRRERVRRAVALALTEEALLVDDERGGRRLAVGALRSIELALSPLIGRLGIDTGTQRTDVSYPAPLSVAATAFLRQLRRAWANA